MLEVIQQAYGAAKIQPGNIDTSYGELHFFASLDAGFQPGAPVGARLQDAFENLLDQMLSQQFPEHPHFEAEVRRTDVNRALDYLTRAAAEPGGRVPVEQAHRNTLSRVCNRLKVGEMLEAHLLFTADTFPVAQPLRTARGRRGARRHSAGRPAVLVDRPAPGARPRPAGAEPAGRGVRAHQ